MIDTNYTFGEWVRIGLFTVIVLGTIVLGVGVVDELSDWLVAAPAILAAIAGWLLFMTEGVDHAV